MICQLLVIFMFLYCAVLRWKARHRIAFSKHFKNDIKSIPILGHAYLLPMCKTDNGRWKLLKLFGDEALKQGGALCSWNGHRLYFIVADPVISEPIMKSCLEKDDAMKLTLAIVGNGSAVADECERPNNLATFCFPVPIWRPRRKVLVQTFSQKYLVHFEEIFSKHSMTMMNQLRKFAGQGSLSIAEHVVTYTMDSVCETTLGIEAHAQENPDMKILEAFKNSCHLLSDRIMKPWLHFNPIYKLTAHHTELMGYVNTIDTFILEVISEKRKELALRSENNNDNTSKETNSRKSFLDLMIESSDYGDNTLKEELVVLFTAGTDTSSLAISFTSVLMARHPSIQEKVYQELREVFGDSKRPVLYEDLPHLKYLEAVIKESLRLYPPAPILLRKVENDVILPSGLTLPEDTGVMVNVYSTHRNTEYWGTDAAEFRPERFIDTPLKHPAAFMAFSTGPRNCVGYRYAMMSMKTALATLLRHYRILPTSEKDIRQPIDLKFDIMLRATDGFQVILEPRP